MTTEKPEAQPAGKPAARIVSEKPREKIVDIDFHVEFDGQVYSNIKLRRVTGKEINDYLEAISSKDAPSIVPPMVVCPQEVWDAMDDDDRYKVEREMVSFFPQRLRDMAGSILDPSADASAQ